MTQSPCKCRCLVCEVSADGLVHTTSCSQIASLDDRWLLLGTGNEIDVIRYRLTGNHRTPAAFAPVNDILRVIIIDPAGWYASHLVVIVPRRSTRLQSQFFVTAKPNRWRIGFASRHVPVSVVGGKSKAKIIPIVVASAAACACLAVYLAPVGLPGIPFLAVVSALWGGAFAAYMNVRRDYKSVEKRLSAFSAIRGTQ
jgi:hypothetical protein